MKIIKDAALIEALLLEDLPDCNATSDVECSDEENVGNVLPATSRTFDEIFEEALEYSLDQAEVEGGQRRK